MRAARALVLLVLLLPTIPATGSQADAAGDVTVAHSVGTTPVPASPYASCTQPAADVLGLEGGADGASSFRLAVTLDAWGTDPACSTPLLATSDARLYSLVGQNWDLASPVSRLALFWTVTDDAERVTARMVFRDGKDGTCAGGTVGRDGATLSYACPLVGTARVGNADRAYDLRGVDWTFHAQANLVVATGASTVRFHDATAEMAART